MIPLVVASERGRAQTVTVATQLRGSRTAILYACSEQNPLERGTIAGESPVCESNCGIAVS